MIKNTWVFSNDSKSSKIVKAKLLKLFKFNKCKITPLSKNIIVLGGDGTFVKAYNLFGKKDVKILLINTGFVGFYSTNIDLNMKKISDFFNNDKNFHLPSVVCCEIGNKKIYGINEIVIQSTNTILTDIYINGSEYETFKGSGLCFCTKTGSTGLNKSLKGSILLSKKEIWQMVEIAPLLHAKYLSIGNSLVLDYENKITLKNFKNKNQVVITNDGYENLIKNIDTTTIYLTKLKAQIAFEKNIKFYLSKLKNVFILGDKK